MHRVPDTELLRQFASVQSDDAFAAIVHRYLGLVRGTALRQLGGNHCQADEVCQAVFLALARKAGSMPPRIVLAGWLFKATRFAAAKLARDEERRVRRQKEAAVSHADMVAEENEERAWQCIVPHLDDSLESLTAKERDAVLLRYFQHQSYFQIGQVLKASEDAAKMRVSRALEKLRRYFRKKGLIVRGALLANVLECKASSEISTSLADGIAKTAAGGGGRSALAGELAESIVLHWRLLRLRLWLIIAAIGLLATSISWMAAGRSDRIQSQPPAPAWAPPGQQWPIR